jgi:hypothetical protein
MSVDTWLDSYLVECIGKSPEEAAAFVLSSLPAMRGYFKDVQVHVPSVLKAHQVYEDIPVSQRTVTFTLDEQGLVRCVYRGYAKVSPPVVTDPRPTLPSPGEVFVVSAPVPFGRYEPEADTPYAAGLGWRIDNVSSVAFVNRVGAFTLRVLGEVTDLLDRGEDLLDSKFDGELGLLLAAWTPPPVPPPPDRVQPTFIPLS